jgi:hypothetical protein
MPEFKFKTSTTFATERRRKGQDAALRQVFGHFGLTVDAIRAKEARLLSAPRPHRMAAQEG